MHVETLTTPLVRLVNLFQRLSSGLELTAKDDAAGLAISERMNLRSAVSTKRFEMLATDSLAQTGEGALRNHQYSTTNA